MIAMALACRPSLVVADEPTTALDVMVQAQVLDVLPGLVKELGVGMMIISHDLSVLADISDRIAVMYAGRVVEQGPADLLFTDPLHPYTARARPASFPRIGDPAARYAPVGSAGRPARPARAAAGLLVRPALPAGDRAVPGCRARRSTHQGAGRYAACIRVGEDDDGRVSRAPTAEPRGARRSRWSSTSRSGDVAVALDGADLTVRSGEIVALVGESGSGKTTLARTLTGLEPPTRGEVCVDGAPLAYARRSR